MEANDKQQVQLAPGNIALLEHVSLVHDALVPSDVHPLYLEQPAFWAHVADKLRPWHEIRARAEDGSWMARGIVLAAERTWAKVRLIQIHEFSPITAALPPGMAPKPVEAPAATAQATDESIQSFIDQHVYKHRGPKGHSIVRKADSQVLVEGLGTKDEAIKWLDTHAREMVGNGLAKAA